MLSVTFSQFQYLNNLKERHVRIIIGEFFVHAARNIMCEAYKQKMTQKQGYVWFLPGWYANDWYDLDMLRQNEYLGNEQNTGPSSTYQEAAAFLPNCTTAEMVEVVILALHFSVDSSKHYSYKTRYSHLHISNKFANVSGIIWALFAKQSSLCRR